MNNFYQKHLKNLCLLVMAVTIFTVMGPIERASAASYPGGFYDVEVAAGLNLPIALEFAPDGRLFVTEKGGTLRIIKNGILNPTPFATLAVDSSVERGLLGVTIDPDFAINRFVYVHYNKPSLLGRVSRLTASISNLDVMEPGSEKVLIDDIPSQSGIHDGGEIHFGDDKKLYVAVGDGGFAFADNSQNLSNLAGKILRINTDGTIPADNPFVGRQNVRPEIYAYGLRNPYTFAVDPGKGRIFVNEVGWNSWEEVNLLTKGGNYGWPMCEGKCETPQPGLIDPVYQYDHNFGSSITGGAFYHGDVYPAEYNGDYFFADYTAGFIKSLDFLNGNTVSSFASGVNSPVNLKLGPDGMMYYASIYSGGISRIHYQPQIPPPPPGTGNGLYGTYFNNKDFTGTPSLSRIDGTINFDWGFGSPGPGINNDVFSARWTGQILSQYTQPYTFTVRGDDGVRLYVNNQLVVDRFVDQPPTETSGTIQLQAGQKYSMRLEYFESYGGAVAQLFWQSPSQPKQIIPQSQLFAQLPGQAPVGKIDVPVGESTYNAGDIITYSGSATDPEDGTLPSGAYSWSVIFHHDGHTHPYLGPINGAKSGTFTTSKTAEPAANVSYELRLTVTDSSGQTHSTSTNIYPNKSVMNFNTSVPGLSLSIDNQSKVMPQSVTGVVGFQRSISAPMTQQLNGKYYEFVSWSDGGSASHTIETPPVNTTFTATYKEVATPPPTQNTVIKVFAAGTPAQGVYPTLELLVDNAVVATFTDIRGDVNARQFVERTYTIPSSVSPDRVKIRFSNDLFINGEDRNVRVDKITLNGIGYESEDPAVYSTGSWAPGTNCEPGNKQSEWLQCAGYFQYGPAVNPPTPTPVPTPPPAETGSVLKIYAAGTPAQGVYPDLEVLVAGTTVKTFASIKGNPDARQFVELVYTSASKITLSQIKLQYLNDLYADPEDRNLRIDKIVLDGVEYQIEDPKTYSTGTWAPGTNCAPGNKQSEWLQCAGYFSF